MPESVPRYPKVLTLGSSGTENALNGNVVIQEKIDGSQFGFGLNNKKEVVIRSRGALINKDQPPKLFKEGVDYILSIKDIIKNVVEPDTYFYCEYLSKPKHNTLHYKDIPKNHIVLFDILSNGKWGKRKKLELLAKELNIDIIPELYVGKFAKKDIKNFIDNTMSYLGKEKIEGIVIKNYNQIIERYGIVTPLFTKYVREEFKERHRKNPNFKSKKQSVEEFINSFKSEARWEKAVQYLRDKDDLEKQPRDIGKIIKRVQTDIVEECQEDIKDFLYKMYIKDIKKRSVRGLAEWYKEKLLDNLKENKER